jgi:hypothetical protein
VTAIFSPLEKADLVAQNQYVSMTRGGSSRNPRSDLVDAPERIKAFRDSGKPPGDGSGNVSGRVSRCSANCR